MDHTRQLLRTAIEAAVLAAREILEVYNGPFDVEHKADNTPLTEADKRANEAITTVLTPTGLPILSEEGRHAPYDERKQWNRLWIVDPLDGTKEFVRRNGEFTVNIALVEDHAPVFGVILAPVTGWLYYGGKSMGAYRHQVSDWISSEPNSIFLPDSLTEVMHGIPVAEQERPFRVVASRSHMSPETQAFIEKQRIQWPNLELINSGSSLKICLVAEGSADVYPRFAPTMEWDTAAGHAIAEGAGKNFTQADGTAMVYNKPDLLNPWFVVS
jgi:3'(2'), 5'-bisphosphate nucleotidase